MTREKYQISNLPETIISISFGLLVIFVGLFLINDVIKIGYLADQCRSQGMDSRACELISLIPYSLIIIGLTTPLFLIITGIVLILLSLADLEFKKKHGVD